MDLDLDDFNPTDAPVKMTLTDPRTGVELMHDGKPVTILVNGPESPIMREHERGMQNRRLKIAATTGRVMLDAATIETELNARVAKAIAGWDNLYASGAPIEYSAAAALDLVSKRIWIRDQVDAFYSNRGNFYRTASRMN